MGVTLLVTKLVPIDPDEDECILQVLSLGKERCGLDPSSSECEVGHAPDERPYAPLDEPGAVGEPSDEMIRFYCRCGQKIKMPAAQIGSVTKCPTCSLLIVIPSRD